jgi:hypothetical protein
MSDSSDGGTLEGAKRQSETMTWVAPMTGERTKATGSESLIPPSARRTVRPPIAIVFAGSTPGTAALARATSDSRTPDESSVEK